MWTDVFVVILVASVVLSIPAIVLGMYTLRSNKKLWNEIQVMAAKQPSSEPNSK